MRMSPTASRASVRAMDMQFTLPKQGGPDGPWRHRSAGFGGGRSELL
ncbi:hypothetical protein ACFFX0_08065 [Citricoccus parietis]|uniref:Uncharacterized protein n=1 Tax=Citricoccus parietis TaxID=592307 RepID=A0ABV5FWU5_9MICC